MAHLEPPGADGFSMQGSVCPKAGGAFRHFLHHSQFAVVIGLLPELFTVAAFDKKGHASEPCLADTHAIAHRNGKAITMGFGLELGFIGSGELPARYQLCAVPFADVVMRLGALREIGRQVTLEGEALGEQAAQGAAGGKRKGQQGQVQGAPDPATTSGWMKKSRQRARCSAGVSPSRGSQAGCSARPGCSWWARRNCWPSWSSQPHSRARASWRSSQVAKSCSCSRRQSAAQCSCHSHCSRLWRRMAVWMASGSGTLSQGAF